MQNDAKLLEDSLLIIWNDRNPTARLMAMNEIYATDIVFYESNGGDAITGYESINQLISRLQEQWPAEFSFQLTTPALVNHQVQHISWVLGIPGMLPVASGMDIAIVKDHKIQSLHLFLNTTESNS